LTECDDLSEAEAVTLMTAVLTIKAAATLVMTTAAAAVTVLIEVAVTERAAAVYRRGRWFVSNVSDVRTMWNITSPGYLNNDRPWSSV
jgi:indole-3-glycerol phosphate synthase